MDKVYMVKFNWSVEDASDLNITLFKNYKDAYALYKQLISEELDPDISWVGSELFDENGNVNDGYRLDNKDNSSNNGDSYWHVTDCENDWRYSRIDLKQIEVL